MARVNLTLQNLEFGGVAVASVTVAHLVRGGVFPSAVQKIPASEDAGHSNILRPLKISTDANES
jgi:hypothetical protein